MSKKTLFITLAGVALLVLAILLISDFGRKLPFSQWLTPTYTEIIPEKRPRRLDQALLERFEGKTMDDILKTLAREKAQADSETPTDEAEPHPPSPLLASLPDRPFPFAAGSEPKNKDWLTEFVTSIKQNDSSETSPEDIWRFNVALSALNVSPDTLPDSLKLNESFEPEADTFPSQFKDRSLKFVPPYAIGNFDASPDLELLDKGGTRLSKFDDQGTATATKDHGIPYAGWKLYPADFDHDGDLDLYVVRGKGFPNSLYRNTQQGQFEDVTIELGLLSFNDTTAAAWIDYDGDGRLDLLEGSKDHPLKLYHQTAGGTFQPVAWDLKLWIHQGVRDLKVADVSGDGIPDIFAGIDGQADRLLISQPASAWEEWRFKDILPSTPLNEHPDQNLTFFDFNHDGVVDLASYGSSSEGTPFFQIAINAGDETFEDVTETLGFSGEEAISSLGVIDIDQDGYEDLYLGTPELAINRTFWNREGLTFKEMSIASQGSYLDAPESIQARDLDQNGLTDLFYINRAGKLRWLEPQGSTAENLQVFLAPSQIGAKLTATVRDRDWILQSLNYTLDGQSSISLGIGDAKVVESLTLRSPDGETKLHEVEKVSPNQSVVFDQSP